MNLQNYFRRRIAITQEHGSWVFLLSPLCIGLFAGKSFNLSSSILILAALAGFLIRQPVSIIVKVYSGRRSKNDLPAAWFWIIIYGVIGFAAVIGLVLSGFGYILWLAIPGVFVFAWHLYLISKRAERKKIGIEVVASGVLALGAPAAYWIGTQALDTSGWWLWGLTWLQSAASIVYAYLRLDQRNWEDHGTVKKRLTSGRRAILYASFNMLLVLFLSLMKVFSPFLAVPFGLQWLETIWGSIFQPAVGMKPNKIGIRQLVVSILFTILFMITWK